MSPLLKTSDNLKAAELFRTNDIDAAVVWSPDDVIATNEVPALKFFFKYCTTIPHHWGYYVRK